MPCLYEIFFGVLSKDILFDMKFQAFSIFKMSFHCNREERLYSAS